MARGITLTRSGEQKVFVPNRGDAWRIRIVASDAENMPNEVFGHRYGLRDAHTGLEGLDFCFVASPEDLVLYPANEPNVAQTPPYFRLDTIDVVVASRKIALDLWEEVQARVCALVEALNRKDRLVVEETSRCGDPLTEEESSLSESLSESMSISESQSV